MAIVGAWCAMWFIVVGSEIEFPGLLHAAFIAVAAANGFSIYQTAQLAKLNAEIAKMKAQTEKLKLEVKSGN